MKNSISNLSNKSTNKKTKSKREELQKDLKIVAGARFNKARRLQRLSFWSLCSLSFISMLLTFISICNECWEVDEIHPFLLLDYSIKSSRFSILTSISILILSIGISLSKLDVKHEKINLSAIKINFLYRKANIKSIMYKKILDDYNNILNEIEINHDKIDYLISKKNNNKSMEPISIFEKYVLNRIELYPFYLIMLVSISVFVDLLNQIGSL